MVDEERTLPEVSTSVVVVEEPRDDEFVEISNAPDDYVNEQEEQPKENTDLSTTSTTTRTSSTSAAFTLDDVREVVSNALQEYDKQQDTEFEQLTRQLDEVSEGVLRVQADSSDGSVDEGDGETATPDESATTTGYALDADQWAVVRDGVKVVSTCSVFELALVAALGGLVAWSIVSGGWRHA